MDRRSFMREIGAGGLGVLAVESRLLAGAPRTADASPGPDQAALTGAVTAPTPSAVIQIPPPTGDPATDTANIQGAIDASPPGARLLFSPTVNGQGYVVDSPISLAELRFYEGGEKESTVISAADGADLPAVMATAAWLAAPASGTYATGQQLTVQSLTIDGNSSGNPGGTGHGLVLMNYRATVRDLVVIDTPGSGIVLSDRGAAAATVAADNCVENRVYDCTIEYPGQYGIWVVDTDLSGRVTDGYLENCVVVGPTGQGLRIERSAGWFISNNHIYGCATDGIFLDQFSGTFFYDNEVDHFGQSGGDMPGTFHGIQINNVIAGRPGAVHNCQVNAEEVAGSTFLYYWVHGAGGIEGNIQCLDNACHCSPQAAAPSSSVAFTYVAGAGSTLHVQGQATNVAYGPAEYLVAGGGGTITFAQPPDPLNLGYATTMLPGIAVGTSFTPKAGNAAFAMFVSAGVTASALRLDVAVSAGHISAGIYASGETGLARKPTTQLASSGAIPCPAVGIATVALPTPTMIPANGYAAISVDNDLVSVGGVNTVAAATVGTAAYQARAHPLPAVAAAANGNSHLPWITSA